MMAQFQALISGLDDATNAGGSPFIHTSLYIEDLDLNVTESQLYDLFILLGPIISVCVRRHWSTGLSLGYGYVNYENPLDGT